MARAKKVADLIRPDAPASAARTALGLGTAAVADAATFATAAALATTDGNVTANTTALALKAPLASPALTGTPTAPTAAGATNTTQVATTAFVRGEVTALVNSAPSVLDTLGEIATALQADESTAAALATTVAAKIGSISLTTPSVLYATPITFAVSSGSATGALTLLTQAANKVLAGPASGADATPTMRALVAADLPNHSAALLTSGTVAVARLPLLVGADGTVAGTAGLVPAPAATDNVKFLRGDGTYAAAGGGLTVGSAIASGTNSRVLYQNASGNLAESTNLAFDGTSLDVGANLLKFSSSYSIAQSGNGFVIANAANDLVDIVFNTSATGPNLRYENRGSQLLDSGLPELQIGAVGVTNATPIKVNRDRARIAGRIASTVGLTVLGQPSQTAPLIALTGLSDTVIERRVGAVYGVFATATDASFKGRISLAAADSTGTDREGVRVESDGTQPLVSFYGVVAVARAATPTTLADVIAIVRNVGLAS